MPAILFSGRERQEERRARVVQSQVVAHRGDEIADRQLLRRPVRIEEPRLGLRRQQPAVAFRRGRHHRRVVGAEHEADGLVLSQQALGGSHCGFLHLLVTGRGHEPDTRAAQRDLALDRAFLLANQPGHARDDEQEEHGGRDDHHFDVGIAELFDEADARRDQAGRCEKPKARLGQAASAIGGRLLERPHRRMEGCRAPKEVVRDPTDVVAQLVVVGALEQRVVVRRVDGQKRHDAGDEEIERGSPLAGIDRQADRCREEQHVAERIRRRDELRVQRKAREVEVRRDQEHPGQERDADGQDRRVDQPWAIAVRVAPPHQHEQSRHQRRVDGQIEPVSGRGERHVVVEELRVAVRVDVPGKEEELAEGQEQPRQPRLGPVHDDARDDCERGRQPEHVDQRAVALEMRSEQVGERQKGAHGEIGDPDLRQRGPRTGEQRHAARSSARLG